MILQSINKDEKKQNKAYKTKSTSPRKNISSLS